ncbi:hypothetical protein GCM10023189_20670 [Nibrella saemangeumensis]|uniref:Galactose oxidase n=1 Tax=Nibrella saemangeumensis TaxID=1084526 RepID=A0ABP8MQ72_9BACT
MPFRNSFLPAAFLVLVPLLTTYHWFSERALSLQYEVLSSAKDYEWQQILPAGNGSHQYEWKSGSFPMGIIPILAFDGKLWMTGQKASWSSSDGITWVHHPKKDWGERINLTSVFFNNTLWMYGGMQYQDRQLLNEVWYSTDGVQWQQAENAAWAPRKGQSMVAFRGKLWLFGGVSKVSKDFVSLEMKNDVWSSADGFHWTNEVEQAPWAPRDSPAVLVLRDTLYLLSGQGLADVWRSPDGKSWTQLTSEAPWEKRFDNGALVFDDKLWVFGGRDTTADHHRAAQNDVWYSANGGNWTRQAEHAPWTVRSGGHSVVFKNQLWLFSGKHTGANPVWKGDIWALKKSESR